MQSRLPLPHTVLVGIAVVFAAISILHGSLWMYYVRIPGNPVELGFNRQHNIQYDEKMHGFAVLDVLPESPAERAGLRPGDWIIGINGQMLQSSALFDETWARSKPGDAVELTVKRPGEPKPLTLHGVFRASTQAREGLARRSASQVTSSFPALFLVVGFTVLFLRLEDPHAWLLALMFAGFVAAPNLSSTGFSTMSPALRAFVSAYHSLFFGFLPAFFYIFFAMFPARSPLERRFPWLKWAALALGALVGLPGFRSGEPAWPSIVAHWIGAPAARASGFVLTYSLMALGLVSLTWNAWGAASSPEVRRKSRVIVWGTLVGLAPILVEGVAINFLGFRPPFWLDTTLILLLLLYPLSFAYAVVKHRVMEIPVLLRRSARYVFVQRGFFVLLFAGAAIAIALFTHTVSRYFPEGTNIGMGLSAVFGIVLVWVSAPVVKRGTARIDRAFFRSAYDVRVILQDLTEKIRTVMDRHELAELLELQIEGALHPKSLVCYLEAGDGKLAAEGGRVPSGLGTIPATLPLLSELVRRGKAWDAPPAVSDEAGYFAPLAPECLVPILGRKSGLIGLLVLGQRLSEEPYSNEDKHLLNSVASQAGVTLENIALAEKMAERMETERRIAMEMDIARRVQARLFPQNLPPLKTLEYVGGCVQAREVGGDYYDFLDMGPGVVGIVLADISGKGMSGALLMANLQANLRSQYAVALDDLPRLLQSVNRLFYENTTDDSYATMFFGVYDDASRRLRYANCGHVAPLLLRGDGSLQCLTSTTTVLGLFPKWKCPIEEVELHPGDLLVICTDGVTEAPNSRGEEYGEEQLAEVMRKNRSLSVNELLGTIQASVQEFSGQTQADDITLIVARVR